MAWFIPFNYQSSLNITLSVLELPLHHKHHVRHKLRDGTQRGEARSTLMLLVTNLANTQYDAKNLEKSLKPWQMGTHLKVLRERFPMITNKTGLDDLSIILHPCALEKSSIGRINSNAAVANLANTKLSKKPEKWLKPWHMGTHLKVLRESFPMNINMTALRCFFKNLASLCFGWK